MIEPFLKKQLEPVARRHQRSRVLIRWAQCWWLTVGACLLVWLGCFALSLSPQAPVLSCIGVGLLLGIWQWKQQRSWAPDYREIARKIESQHPQLHALLLTAIEQKPDPVTGQFNFLQERVIEQAVQESRRHSWIESVPTSTLFKARLGHLAGIAALAAIAVWVRSPSAPGVQVARSKPVDHFKGKTRITVLPGDVEVEKGTPLVLMARFEGTLPASVNVTLIPTSPTASSASAAPRQIALVKSLDDPVFATTLSQVDEAFVYRVAYDAATSESYRVSVFEFPRLERADARITHPTYTRLPEKTIPDTRRVSAVEGSLVSLDLALNKPVQSAWLESRQGHRLSLHTSNGIARAWLAHHLLSSNLTLDLKLVDAQNRTNKAVAQFTFEALPNRRPEIKITSPRGDQKASPLEEVDFASTISDDFGLLGYGLSYNLPRSNAVVVAVATNTAPGEKQDFRTLLKLETLKLEPGRLISWHFYADDVGPDGKPRRTASDLFFLEIRPFEQVFRKSEGQESEQDGQTPPGQQESEKLLELQKQVVTATFKLQGRDPGKAGGPFAKDTDVVKQAQEQALQLAQGALQNLEDPESRVILEGAAEEMKKAVDLLTRAADAPSVDDAIQALEPEQAAYQALLRLQAREFMVRRSRSRGQMAGQSSSMQQQLDQLDMREEKDRYETQRQAQQRQDPQQQENLQVLNRLKELAQRQEDLNEQIKEAQAALQAAKTEEEREEVRRRLKRLQEQQQEMLADLDELKQRMDRSTNQENTAEARRQMEQTRGEMQRASEALSKGQTAQALAEGSRAQQNLQEAKEDFRKKTSNQFADELRQMRNQARQLAEKQQELTSQVQELANPKRKTLIDSTPKEQTAEELARQKSSLTNLLSQMRQMSEQAETSEPLLSRQLYDTLRKTEQNRTEAQLDVSGEMVRRGFQSQAAQLTQKTGQALDELRAGVERAAESVLGDDTEALKQARKELEALGAQAEQELAQAARASGQQGAASGQPPPGRSGLRPSPGQGEPQEDGSAGQQDSSAEQAAAGPNEGPEPGAQQGQPGSASQQGANRRSSSSQQQARAQAQGKGQSGQQPQQPGDSQEASATQESTQGQSPSQAQAQGQGQGQNRQPGSSQARAQSQGQRRGQQQGQGQGQGQQQGEGQPQPSTEQANQGQPGSQPGAQQANDQGEGRAEAQAGRQGQGQGRGQQPGQQQAQQNGKTQTQNAQAGQTPGQGQGRSGRSPNQNQAQNPNPQQQGQNPGRQAQQGGQRGTGGSGGERGNLNRQRLQDFFGGEGGEVTKGPLTGEDFSKWADRLRDVEEMLDDPQLRSQVAQVREQARTIRNDYKRSAKEPQWDLVRTRIIEPLAEVRQRVGEELAKRDSKDSTTPIDRDPVPKQYSESVKRYYERLGSSR